MTQPAPDAFSTLLDLEVLILGSLPPQDTHLWPQDGPGRADRAGLELYDLQTLQRAADACQRFGTDDAERALNLWAMEQAER